MVIHKREQLTSKSKKPFGGFWKRLKGSRVILILYSIFIITISCFNYASSLLDSAYFYAFFLITFWLFLYSLYFFSSNDSSPFETIGFWIFFVFIVAPLTVYTIILFFKSHLTFLPEVGNVSDWVGFSGSVLGGSITMMAVYLTLKSNRKNNDRRLSAELTPIIRCVLIDPDISEKNPIKVTNNKIHIYIHNTSDNHALIIKSTNSYIQLDGYEKHYIDEEINSIMCENNAIAGKSRRNIEVSFPSPPEESAIRSNYLNFEIRVTLIYSDFLNLESHKLNYEYDGKITSSDNFKGGYVSMRRRLNSYSFFLRG